MVVRVTRVILGLIRLLGLYALGELGKARVVLRENLFLHQATLSRWYTWYVSSHVGIILLKRLYAVFMSHKRQIIS